MDNSAPLLKFGIAVVVILGLFIVVPFLRGKKDLLTAWNTLLFGIILFVGLGSVAVYYLNGFAGYPQLDWYQPTTKEIAWYMAANAAFIATLIAAYYLNTPAKRFAQRRLRKWPPITAPVTFCVLGYCCFIFFFSIVFQRVTFVGQVGFFLAQMAAPAAATFSFQLWYRNRTNFLWLLLFIFAFVGAGFYSMIVSGGRRLLLSVVLGPILYVYWAEARRWSHLKIVLALSLAVAFTLTVSVVYSRFRFYTQLGEARSAKGIVEQIRTLSDRGDLFIVLMRDPLEYFCQSAGHYALLTQRFVAQNTLPPVSLNSLRFLASYPIPRKVWPGKPNVLGVRITHNAVNIPTTNWGCGVAGQGAYEGGIPALMLYAVLLAFGARFLDEPLQQQPSNPFLIYILAASIPHIVGIPRGDMGTMVGQVGQAVLTAVILGVVCRAIFGTARDVGYNSANIGYRPAGGLDRAQYTH